MAFRVIVHSNRQRCVLSPNLASSRRAIVSSYHTGFVACGGDKKKDEHLPPPPPKPEEKKKEIFSKQEIIEHFDEIHKLRTGTDDYGEQREEREHRPHMKRVPRFRGDLSTLEEKHILYGPRGTIKEPVTVYSVYPTRTVGCNGSEETQLHEIAWHIVKREKPCVCLECGQVFQLVTPEGEEIQEKHHHH